MVWGGIGEKKSNKGTQWYQQDRIYDCYGISPALSNELSDIWVVIYEEDSD